MESFQGKLDRLFHFVNLILDCWPDLLKFDIQPLPGGLCLLFSQGLHEVRDVHFQQVSPAEKPQGGSVQDCGSNTIAPENTPVLELVVSQHTGKV